MPVDVKGAVAAAFLEMAARKDVDKITVKDIVADCGINRNTFYYYFEDMPKLIESIVEDDAEQMIQSYPTIEKFKDCLDAAITLALTKKRAVLHIYVTGYETGSGAISEKPIAKKTAE